MPSSHPADLSLDPRVAAIRNFHGKYPPQLWWLFLSEMWERFCFYGMRGVLTVFMIKKLLTRARPICSTARSRPSSTR
jgi:dipeptide/tripeptide permease